MRRIRLPRGLKLTDIALAVGLGVISGLYTFTPIIKEYKVFEAKVLEERKKLQESHQIADEKVEKKEVLQTTKVEEVKQSKEILISKVSEEKQETPTPT